MKKILFGLLTLGTVVLGGCYEDKGNYSYNFGDINSVDTLRFTPEAYSGLNGWIIDFMKSGEADTVTERVTVNPTFSAPDKADQMDYYWYRQYTWNGQTVKDTLTTPGYMDVLIPENGNVSYRVILELRDRETEISYFTQLTVKTREWYTNSLFVLHGNSTQNQRLGNVEFLGDEPTITLDAFERSNTDPNLHEPFKNARVLGFRMNLREPEMVVFKTNGEAEVYNPFGLKRLQDTYFVMPPVAVGSNLFVAKTLINEDPAGASNDFRCVLSNDGRFYISRGSFRFYEPGLNTENTEHLTTDQYRVSIGTRTGDYYVFWDDQGKRFIHNTIGGNNFPRFDTDGRETASLITPVLDSHIDAGILAKLSGMQPVYAYVNNFNYFQSADEMRFLFYDPATESNMMCMLTVDGGGGKTKAVTRADKDEESTAMFAADTLSLDGLHIEPGTPIVYTGAYSLDFFFYADGSTLYRYNVQSGDQDIIYEAPSGYEIVLLKFRQNIDYLYWGNLYRYLSIGLNRNNEGAVAEIKLTAAGDLDESFEPQLYEGFDRITDVQFCNELMYTAE